MIAASLSKILILIFGVLKPVYSSCKALSYQDEREIRHWQIYWIVFGLFTLVTAVTDVTFNWIPLYYELKVVFVKWLLSPTSNGALYTYENVIRPFVEDKKEEIDNLIARIEEYSWEHFIQIVPKILTFIVDVILKHVIVPLCYPNTNGVMGNVVVNASDRSTLAVTKQKTKLMSKKKPRNSDEMSD